MAGSAALGAVGDAGANAVVSLALSLPPSLPLSLPLSLPDSQPCTLRCAALRRAQRAGHRRSALPERSGAERASLPPSLPLPLPRYAPWERWCCRRAPWHTMRWLGCFQAPRNTLGSCLQCNGRRVFGLVAWGIVPAQNSCTLFGGAPRRWQGAPGGQGPPFSSECTTLLMSFTALRANL